MHHAHPRHAPHAPHAPHAALPARAGALSLLSLALSLALLAGATPVVAQDRLEFRELHMGMEVRLVMYAPDSVARVAARHAFDRIAALEQMMSDYRPDSEVRALERHAGVDVPVSDELFQVLSLAVDVAERSGGAFDPTVGPLVSLWRDARRSGRLPERARLDSARALVDWRAMVLDARARRARLARSGMRLDVGGVAKGYILQRALETLRAHGVTAALVQAGGDIVVGAAPPGAEGWRFDTPFADSRLAAMAAALVHAAVATSGPSGQLVEIEGGRYSHVLDPRTGQPLTSGAHATVIATDAALADALATALTVIDVAGRARLVEAYGGRVLAWSIVP